MVKNLPANAGDIRDTGSIPGSGRSPGVGNGNPLCYSCLENPMARGAWRVHGFAKSQTRLSTVHTQGDRKPSPAWSPDWCSVAKQCLTLLRPHGQAPLSMGFPRQEYWSGLPCPPPGDLPDPGIEPTFLTTPSLADRLFASSTTGKPHISIYIVPCVGLIYPIGQML